MKALLPVLVIALMIYSLLDCARTPEESMPARMPKLLWIVLIVLFPGVGSIAWIIVSRVRAAEERGGLVEPTVWSSREGTRFRRPERPRPVAPDDDPDFLRDLEQDIRRRRHQQAQGGGTGGDGRTGGTSKPGQQDQPGQDGREGGPRGDETGQDGRESVG